MGHKYRARPVVIDGIRFASTKEGKRYAELKLLAKAGEIRNLELQTSFAFSIGERLMFSYLADFTYFETASGRRVVEDVKGIRTPVYKLKKRIVEAAHGIEIKEI